MHTQSEIAKLVVECQHTTCQNPLKRITSTEEACNATWHVCYRVERAWMGMAWRVLGCGSGTQSLGGTWCNLSCCSPSWCNGPPEPTMPRISCMHCGDPQSAHPQSTALWHCLTMLRFEHSTNALRRVGQHVAVVFLLVCVVVLCLEEVSGALCKGCCGVGHGAWCWSVLSGWLLLFGVFLWFLLSLCFLPPCVFLASLCNTHVGVASST
jgi:hypothetical protein